MANSPELNNLKKEIADLKKEISRLGGDTFKDIDAAIQSLGGGLNGAQKVLQRMQEDAADLRNEFTNIASTLKNTLNDLNGQERAVKTITKSYNTLESLATKLQNHRNGENILSIKQLKIIEKQTQQEVEKLNTAKETAKSQKEELELKIKTGKATASETEEYNKITNYIKELNPALNLKNSYLKRIVALTQKEREEEEKIQKTLGITGQAFKGIANTLQKIGIETESIDEISTSMRKAAESGKGLDVISAGLKGVFKAIKEGLLTDPAVQIAVLVKSFKVLYDIGADFSQQTANMARNMGINTTQAREFNKALLEASQNSANQAASQKNFTEANNNMNDALGTSVVFSQKMLEDQTSLTKQAGLTNDEAAKLAEISVYTGKTQENIYDSIGKQNKGVLSNKKVLSEVLKTSGQLSALYKNDPVLIAKAVIQAQKLGLTLEQTKKISSGLLNFEDSISAELEAELITGKDLNFERARSLALQGKTAEAAEEIAKQVGSSAEFSRMNVIAQESLARAANLTVDELADSLVKREAIAKIQRNELGENGKRLTQEEAATKLKEQQMSATEKMAAASDKLKESLSSVIAGPLGKIVDTISGVIDKIAQSGFGKVLGVIGAVGAVIVSIGGLIIAGKLLSTSIMRQLEDRKKGKRGDTASRPLFTDDVGNSGGSRGSSGGGLGGDDSDYSGPRTKTGKPDKRSKEYKKYKNQKSRAGKSRGRGKFGRILGGLSSMMGMAGMVSGNGSYEDDGMESMTDMASSASDMISGGGGSTTKAASAGKNAAKGGGLFSKIGGFFGGMGKKIGGSMGGVKKFFSGPIAKGFGKALGPILAVIESVSSVSSMLSDAKERKAAGEKVNTGKLGKSLVQAAAYPIANASVNLIPGVGTAVSIADGILGAFGMSPIKWLSDNLISLVPDDAFTGLGNMALGSKVSPSEPASPKPMANGGITKGPLNALIGEAGAEAVIPLNEFYAKLKEFIQPSQQLKELKELIQPSQQPTHIYLDGMKLSAAMNVNGFKIQ
jgi:hypothetical protein